MKKNKQLILLFLFVGGILTAQPRENIQSNKFLNKKPFVFIENKGQLADVKGMSLSEISFYGSSNGVNVYFQKDKIKFVFTKATFNRNERELTNKSLAHELPQLESVQTSRIELEFSGANLQSRIIPEDVQSGYDNFYLEHDNDEGITNVKKYKKLTYKDIYTNIDLVLDCKEGGMEYSFIVHPSGNLGDIRMKWHGNENNIDDHIYSCPLGSIRESFAIAFNRDENGVKGEALEIKESILMENDGIGHTFYVQNFSSNKDLVIDPSLCWATYIGGTNDEIGWSIISDNKGYCYGVGVTASKTGFGTKGAFMDTLWGLADAYITKFDTSGKIAWSTYFGGDKDDWATSLDIDKKGAIYVCGISGSLKGIGTAGTEQSYGGSGKKVFLAKFTSAGKRTWGTYYSDGGSVFQCDMVVNNKGNPIVSGMVDGKGKNFATKGAYQKTLVGDQNTFVAEFNGSGKRIWGTYYGGDSIDQMTAVTTDRYCNIYVVGRTYSSNGLATKNAFKKNISPNSYDGFILKMDSSGMPDWATYYGSGGWDWIYDVTCDSNCNVYFCGRTQGTDGIASPGSYDTLGHIEAGFIAKFDTYGNRVWGRFLGDNDYNEAICIKSDMKNHIFVGGRTSSTSGIATYDAFQPNFNSGIDAFVARFDTSGKQIWGSYLSGDTPKNIAKIDEIADLALDTFCNLYVTGFSNTDSGLATAGSYKDNSSGGSFVTAEGFIAKIGGFVDNGILTETSKNMIDFKSLKVYPNPFSGFTTIEYSFSETCPVKAEVFDLTGRLMITLANEIQSQGQHTLKVDGIEAGTYILRLQIGEDVAHRKIVSLK